MIVYFCGAHGVGKTTMVRNLNFDNMPVIKITNIDYSKEFLSGSFFGNQLKRYSIYFGVMKNVSKCPSLILIDRAPISLKIYSTVQHELGLINDKYYNHLMKLYSKEVEEYSELAKNHKELYIYLKADLDFIIENIKIRGRDKSLNEEDTTYLSKVISMYDDYFSNNYKNHYIVKLHKPRRLSYKNAEKYIKNLIEGYYENNGNF